MESGDRNIVMVTADSLRADHCGFVNGGMATTPTLDRMANDGVVFENAIAPGPRTPSSMPEIFTGEPLPKTRADRWDWKVRTARIGGHLSNHETIAQRFSEMGYSTAAYTANPWTSRSTNFHRGFDRFQEVKHDTTRALVSRFSGTVFIPIVWASRWVHKDSWFSQWTTFYKDVLETAKELDKPYFLWVFLLDTHTPYVVPRRDRKESSTAGMYYALLRSSSVFGEATGKSYYRDQLPASVESRIKQAYRDAIRSVDRFVNVLWRELQEDDPVFVFHSDHGEAFNEHGTYGHQQALYEENVRVPLVMYNTDNRATLTEPVSLRSLPEMLTSCAGDERPDPSDWTSEYVVSRTEDSETMAVRSGQWKYILTSDSAELYDLTRDPGEQRNLIDQEERTVAELHDVLETHKQQLPEQDERGDQQTEPDAELKSRLESLGYLG